MTGVPGGARLVRQRVSSPVQRLALFLCALHRSESAELLEGLAAGPRREALAFSAEVLRWDSSRRQARLALEFAPRDQSGERLRGLLEGAPPRLRAALLEAAPVELRSASGEGPPPGAASPALAALAARLVREASDRPAGPSPGSIGAAPGLASRTATRSRRS